MSASDRNIAKPAINPNKLSSSRDSVARSESFQNNQSNSLRSSTDRNRERSPIAARHTRTPSHISGLTASTASFKSSKSVLSPGSDASSRFNATPSKATVDFMNRWGVVTTSHAGNLSPGRITTIEAHSPYSINSAQNLVQRDMPYLFGPESSTKSLKRKFEEVRRDQSAAQKSDGINGFASSSGGPLMSAVNLSNTTSQINDVTAVDKGKGRAAISVSENAQSSLLQMNRNGHLAYPGRGSNERIDTDRSSPSLPMHMGNVTDDWTASYDLSCELESRAPQIRWEPSELRNVTAAIKAHSSPPREPINPDDFLDMTDEHRLKIKENRDNISASSPRKSTNTQEVRSNYIPQCAKHKSKDKDAYEECDSDCFEEYDPLDDIEEVRRALENDRKNPSYRPRVSKPEQQRKRDKVFRDRRTSRDASRRPYLSRAARTSLQDLPLTANLDNLVGKCLHMSFTKSEMDRVWFTAGIICQSSLGFSSHLSSEDSKEATGRFIHSPRISLDEKQNLLISLAFGAAPYLPGRTEDDIAKYVSDTLETDSAQSLADMDPSFEIRVVPPEPSQEDSSWSDLILARQAYDGRIRRQFPISHSQIQATAAEKSISFLRPFRYFEEGASDVVDCVWDATGQHFALACTTYNDTYNRPGNLLLGDMREDTIKFMSGHLERAPSNNPTIIDRYLHSTVTSVDFSDRYLYSGSYDQTIKMWNVKEKTLHRSISFSSKILRLKANPSFANTIAACYSNGDVIAFRPGPDSEAEDAAQVFAADDPTLEPTVLAWSSVKSRLGWLFVGYDAKEVERRLPGVHTGDLRVYDIVKGALIQKITPGTTRQFDICLDSSENLLIAGAASGSMKKMAHALTHVRIFDLRTEIRKQLELDSPQKDINKVTISPCTTYVTSSGTNGKTCVWDIRFRNKIVHELSHGESRIPLAPGVDREDIDTGVTFASWTANGTILVTGGSDGVVKVWDPTRADPFLYDMAEFADPVMSGAFSADGDQLIIGETTGKATVLSYAGRHVQMAQELKQDRSMVTTDSTHGEEEISGVECANELLRERIVVLREGFDGRLHAYGR